MSEINSKLCVFRVPTKESLRAVKTMQAEAIRLLGGNALTSPHITYRTADRSNEHRIVPMDALRRSLRYEIPKFPKESFDPIALPVNRVNFVGRLVTNPYLAVILDDPEDIYAAEYRKFNPRTMTRSTPHISVAKKIDSGLLTDEIADRLQQMMPSTFSFGPARVGQKMNRGVSVGSMAPKKSNRLDN